MTRGRWIALIVVVIVAALAGWGVVSVVTRTSESEQRQAGLEAFYTPPDTLPGPPGTLIRSEPLGITVAGATALRILYVSQRADGTPAASGGMVFIPTAPSSGERPVVAWAHGTIGGGPQCAPSRAENPVADTTGWLDQMIALGWVVTATDYVGLGTPGTQGYLVGADEARDVVNSVRAARSIRDAHAGTTWAVWGHSQGGHAALWTGELAASLSPELTLVGVAAAAPAAYLPEIMTAQWSTPVGWVIGPAVLESWPLVDPALPTDVVTEQGRANTARLDGECVTAATLEGLLRSKAGQQFFASDPSANPAWLAVATEETPAPLPAALPVLMVQGTADDVVLPNPNALLQDDWCAAGSTLSVLWLGGVGHVAAASTGGPAVVAWIDDRFHRVDAARSCLTPAPVPASARVVAWMLEVGPVRPSSPRGNRIRGAGRSLSPPAA